MGENEQVITETCEIELLKKENERLRLELKTYKELSNNFTKDSKFKLLFNSISDAVYYFKEYEAGIAGEFIEVNETAYTRLGYTREEMLNMSPHDIDIHSSEEMVELLTEVYNNDTTSFETVHLHKHGSHIPVEITTHIFNVQGEKFILSVCRDMTFRKKAEESLHRLESFYNHSSEGIAIFDLDGKVMQANKAFENIFGYTEAEVKGKRLPVTPDFTMKDAEFLLNETLKGNSIKGFETIKQRKDGEFITVGITMSPLRDKNTNEIYALAGLVRDITEQHAIRVQLESFISHNLDPILIFNEEEKLIRTNGAFERVFGWKERDLLGLYINEMPIIPSEKMTEVINYTEVIRANNGIKGIESYRLRKDGTLVDVLLTTFSIKNEFNKNTWFVVILKDITEKKKAEKLLVDSEKLSVAGELAASIAHEIRNPITAIKGFLQIMEEGIFDKAYYRVIDSEMNRIELILKELLLLAKPQIPKLERKNICEALEQSIALLSAQANMNSIVINKEYEKAEYTIVCEENKLKQVFINVIKNAIEAMPNGGHLSIQMRAILDNKKLLVRFIDQGYGIPENVLLRLGEPFYTTKEKGTGLGFMVCKSIIEDHGGEINVFSEVNVGTKIEIVLPLVNNELDI
ncbi:PAS domain S-box protein [Bacillus luteolus]|uniref:histidine kinase n=1 Tax=Litchfieldia luteola TaxID=682179 RepID=A0ABR9QMP7_9BACI|nr:PAS domain-containing sensor histidine kinase [Cytobacillus luteolus]MBE4909780.1 PAS domain S-box protein [Cytobacillus luteolus]MBP1942677.1 PAS domain S-box-containing protein [Cytobacillus luteolus]